MGNRSYLAFGQYCFFEANSCLPITWFALFAPEDYFVEKAVNNYGEEYDECKYQIYVTLAKKRTEKIIAVVKDKPIWAYLRPLEFFLSELKKCAIDEIVELDGTEYSMFGQGAKDDFANGVKEFTDFIQNVTGDEQQDIVLLNNFISNFSFVDFSAIKSLNADDKMFFLVGAYFSESELSIGDVEEYFNEDYWKA